MAVVGVPEETNKLRMDWMEECGCGCTKREDGGVHQASSYLLTASNAGENKSLFCLASFTTRK